MSKIASLVSELVRPTVETLGLELWDVEYQREGGQWVLRVVIDHADGVSIQHCETVSRAIDPLLDEADPIEGSYVLQVSSAGLERVLRRPSDFERFLGHTVEAKLYRPLDGRKEVQGCLTAHDSDSVTIDDERLDKKLLAQVRLRVDF